MPFLVHAQLAALEHLAVGFLGGGGVLERGAAQNGPDPFNQQTLRKRFTDEVVGPIFRPNNSSICSSFEVRKITGRYARHLDIKNGEIGGAVLNPSRADAPSV